jgi:hypothetical protein
MKKKKRFAHAQRFIKKYNLLLNVLIMILSFILPLIVGQETVIIKTVTVHRINLDVTDAYAHPSASVTVGDSVTMTVQNSSGIYTNGVNSNNSANPSVQNSSRTNTNGVRFSASVTMQVQNASGTFTFNGS